MNKKFISLSFLIILLCVAIITLSGCGKSNETINSNRTIVDITGAEIVIPAEVNKVINLNPFGCQLMIGLGLQDYLIGISEDTFETPWLEVLCPEACEIKTYSDETAAEVLLAANPDVVFSQDPEVAENLRSKGIPCVTYAYLTIDDFKYNLDLIGEILGKEAKEKCDLYKSYLDNKIVEVENVLGDADIDIETMHYINANSDKGFYKTAGENSTTDYCAKLAYVKLATNSLISFPESKVDAEALLAVNPDNVIIGGRYQHVIYDDLFSADEWKHITAIEKNQVFKIPMGISAWNRYSIETALLIPWTASVIYPEYYEFDSIHETIEFYKMFMGYELTEEQADYMIKGLLPNGEKEISNR